MTRRQAIAILLAAAGLGAPALQAQDGERFYVTGFVKSPGSYVHRVNMTVLQGIDAAGGFTAGGSPRGVKIIRDVNNERVELDVTLDSPVLPNDVIRVRRRLQ